MKKLYHFLIWFLLLWFVAGSSILIYMQNIDGVYINQPVTMFVDSQNLQTDKTVYSPGEPVSILVSFCRNRPYKVTSTWKLINETVITFPTTTKVMKKECVKDKWTVIGSIPNYAVPGTHHLESSTEIQINPLNNIYSSYRSRDFLVR